jgi:hypothetical protein
MRPRYPERKRPMLQRRGFRSSRDLKLLARWRAAIKPSRGKAQIKYTLGGLIQFAQTRG